jgi:hypothetical protein
MPDTIEIKGQFSVPCSSSDAFGLPYPGVFLFGEHGAIGSHSLDCVGTSIFGSTVPPSVEQLLAEKGMRA